MQTLFSPQDWQAIHAKARKARARKPRAKPKPVNSNPLSGRRMYAAAKADRLSTSWGSATTSADAELTSSLRVMRARCRALTRDTPHAKRAKYLTQNNVIGNGIGLQAQVFTTRDQLNERINDDIEAAWLDWSAAANCHTGGALDFADMERAAVGELFEAGEVFIRKHLRTFGASAVPFGLEMIEAERVVDEYAPGLYASGQNVVRLGVEVDRYHRPIAYWLRQLHPGEVRLTAFQTDYVERVPADQIIHLRIVDRWPQTRGVPWMHAVAERLNDMNGYSEAEITAARAAACYMGFIESPADIGDDTAGGGKEIALEPAIIEHLAPGEKMSFNSPNRPNTAMDSFMRLMLREVAAGANVSYESLSRDYSQSNYSSSRLALLDDRDHWRAIQAWFIRAFRVPIHREWLQLAVLSGAIETITVEQYALNAAKFEAANFKPRGWGWIDPTKEVEAYKAAIKSGFTTQTAVIAATGEGRDTFDVLAERERELKLAKEKGLLFDTDPILLKAEVAKAAPAPVENRPADSEVPPAEDEDVPELVQ